MKKWKILLNIIMELLVFFGMAMILIFGIPKLMGFFWPFVASWILALLATPFCNFLEKHIKLNKKWSSAVIIILVLVLIAGLGYIAITKLGRELMELFSGAPAYYGYVKTTIKLLSKNLTDIVSPISADFGNQIQAFFNNLLSQMGGVINKFAPKGVEMMGTAAADLTNGFIGTIVMIISAYFFIADRERLGGFFWKVVPEDIGQTARDIKDKVFAALGGFFVAQVKIMCIVFVILLIGFLIIGNPYALLLALVISIVDLLPILGTGTILIPWTLICFLQRDYRQAMFLIILYVVCLVARQFLQPKMIADSMGLDSMTTLVLIYSGYKLDGMKGMILALLIGVVIITLYKLGLFDRKIQRMNRLLYEYRHCEDNITRKM